MFSTEHSPADLQFGTKRTVRAIVALSAYVLVVAACGASQTSTRDAAPTDGSTPTGSTPAPTTVSVYSRPPIPDNSAACGTAYQAHRNKHNICTTFMNYAPQFTAPGQLATTSIFTGATVDANGSSSHHLNKTPEDMGTSSFGATSAQSSYDATMNWTFNASWPTNAVLIGTMQQDNLNSGDQRNYAKCTTGAGGSYLGCHVVSMNFGQPFGNGNKDQAMTVVYALANAPLAVSVQNNTTQSLTRLPGIGHVEVLDDPKAKSDNAGSIPPGQQGSWGGYRAIDGNPTAFRLNYTFLADKTIHKIAIDIALTPTSTSSPLGNWGIDKSVSKCTDSAKGSPVPCQLAFDQSDNWITPVTATVTIG